MEHRKEDNTSPLLDMDANGVEKVETSIELCSNQRQSSQNDSLSSLDYSPSTTATPLLESATSLDYTIDLVEGRAAITRPPSTPFPRGPDQSPLVPRSRLSILSNNQLLPVSPMAKGSTRRKGSHASGMYTSPYTSPTGREATRPRPPYRSFFSPSTRIGSCGAYTSSLKKRRSSLGSYASPARSPQLPERPVLATGGSQTQSAYHEQTEQLVSILRRGRFFTGSPLSSSLETSPICQGRLCISPKANGARRLVTFDLPGDASGEFSYAESSMQFGDIQEYLEEQEDKKQLAYLYGYTTMRGGEECFMMNGSSHGLRSFRPPFAEDVLADEQANTTNDEAPSRESNRLETTCCETPSRDANIQDGKSNGSPRGIEGFPAMSGTET